MTLTFDLLTSKTHLIQRPFTSTHEPCLIILVSGIVKLELRTDAQTDRQTDKHNWMLYQRLNAVVCVTSAALNWKSVHWTVSLCWNGQQQQLMTYCTGHPKREPHKNSNQYTHLPILQSCCYRMCLPYNVSQLTAQSSAESSRRRPPSNLVTFSGRYGTWSGFQHNHTSRCSPNPIVYGRHRSGIVQCEIDWAYTTDVGVGRNLVVG